MDKSITCRPATAVDVPAICELGQLLNAIHHAARPEIYTAATRDFSRDASHWMSLFEGSGQIVFIAHVDGIAAGFITASLSSGSGPLMQPMRFVRIGSVCVAERFWGNGIGRTLVNLVQEWGIQQGAKDIRLAVWSFNVPAVRLYEEIGFETRAFEMGMSL
jgi:ribosomal protein S18 acetylase RimI-like enzyme